MSTQAPDPHHVWWTHPSWGHHAPAHAFIMQALASNPALRVTLIHHASLEQKVWNDLATYPHFESVRSNRLHLIAADPTNKNKPLGPTAFFPAIQATTQAFNEFCASDAARQHPPSRIIIDSIFSDPVRVAAQSNYPDVSISLYFVASSTSLYCYLAPAPHGAGDYKQVFARLKGNNALSDKETSEMMSQVLSARNGKLVTDGTAVHMPGLPDMYDYEREQNNIPGFPNLSFILSSRVDLLGKVDDILAFTSPTVERDALAELSSLLGPEKVRPTGIQVNPRVWQGAELEDGTVKSFLDRQKPDTVLFISFGSSFSPSKTHLAVVLETLLDLRQPFIYCAAHTMWDQGVSDSLKTRFEACTDTALHHVGWFDQIGILSHPSVGWFMTHCGFNSIGESLARAVPLIAWPLIQTDQTINAAMLSTREKPLGIELCQIRLGAEGRPAKRGIQIAGDDAAIRQEMSEVIQQAFQGERGAEIRKSVQSLSRTLHGERETVTHPFVLDFAAR